MTVAQTQEDLQREIRKLKVYQRLAWELMKGHKLEKEIIFEKRCVEVLGLTDPHGGIAVFDRVSAHYVDDLLDDWGGPLGLPDQRGLAAAIKAERDRQFEAIGALRCPACHNGYVSPRQAPALCSRCVRVGQSKLRLV